MSDLINLGFDPDHHNISNESCIITPLQKATIQSDYEIMKLLLESGATVRFNGKEKSKSKETLDRSKKDFLGNPLKIQTGGVVIGLDPLMIVMMKGDAEAIRLLSEHLSTLNYELPYQSVLERVSCVSELFPNSKFPVLSIFIATFAAINSDDDVLKLFTQRDDYNFQIWSETVRACIPMADRLCIDRISNRFPITALYGLINAHDELGYTMLHKAVANRNIETIKLLIELGADPLKKNPDGTGRYHRSPLEYYLYTNGKITDVIGRLLSKDL